MIENTEVTKDVKNQYVDIDSGAIYPSAESAAKAKEEKLKDELENKNPEFVQLTKGIGPITITRIGTKSGSALAVLMFFFENMDQYNTIMVSQNVMADELNISRQTISKAVKILEDEKVIGIGKVGQANVYMVNQYVAWQNGNKKRKTMNLKGNILLGENENKELFKKFNEIEKGSLKMKSVTTKISK